MSLSIRKGHTVQRDAAAAVAEIAAAITQPAMSAVILFVSSEFDPRSLGREIRQAFAVPVIACTTSGEISPLGYPDNSIAAVSIASPRVAVQVDFIRNLQEFSHEQAAQIRLNVYARLQALREKTPATKAFGLLLIDGLAMQEENIASTLAGAMGEIPIVGGSAGDDLHFNATLVYHDGAFHAGCAVLATFFLDHPFITFKTQHFVPMEDAKLVVTEAEPASRIVREINGMPAAEEYARLVGVTVAELSPMIFSKYPVMLRIGGEYYVRSIQKVNDDSSLSFYCAIDEGLVLTLAAGVDLVENLNATFARIEETIPEPRLIIGCECILRRLEIFEKGLQDQVAPIMVRHNVIGFHTYGEQYNGLHVNQTLVGVALGD